MKNSIAGVSVTGSAGLMSSATPRTSLPFCTRRYALSAAGSTGGGGGGAAASAAASVAAAARRSAFTVRATSGA